MANAANNPPVDIAARLAEKAQKRGEARRKETVELFGETLEIRSLMVGEKHRLIDEAFTRKGKTLEPVLAKLVPSLLHKTLHDPTTGGRVFPTLGAVESFLDSVPEDAADEVQAVVDQAMRVSGLNKGAEREAAGNSEASEG